MSDSLSEFALHPLHALSAYCSEKQLMVYDNDCKYNLFKCSFVTQEDKQLSPPHSPMEEPAPSVSSISSIPSESSLFVLFYPSHAANFALPSSCLDWGCVCLRPSVFERNLIMVLPANLYRLLLQHLLQKNRRLLWSCRRFLIECMDCIG